MKKTEEKVTIPTPDEMLRFAEAAKEDYELEDYYESIMTLRDHGWSDRRIARWFNNFGIKATFSQVYYVRTKSREATYHEAVRLGLSPEDADKLDDGGITFAEPAASPQDAGKKGKSEK